MKRLVIGSLLVVTAFLCGFGIARLPAKMEQTFGKTYRKDNPSDVAELRRYIYLALPAKSAVDVYVKETGHPPKTLSDLSSAGLTSHYLVECFGVGGERWMYFVDEDGHYGLYLKLSWDGSLQYHQGRVGWEYCGDASGPWRVEP